MLLTHQDLIPFFKPAYLHRGRKYFENHRVIEFDVDEGFQFVQASVRGSGNNTYQLRIQLIVQQKRLVDIQGDCSCPLRFNCKHVVASLLHLQQLQASQQDEPYVSPSDKWLYQLKAARPGGSTPSPSSERILYVLDLHHDSTGRRLFASTIKTRLQPDGSYTETRKYSGSPESRARFMRDDDRFALLLLNSLKSGSGVTSQVALEGDSGARALNVLIDTGRCHWLNETYPALRRGSRKHSALSWHYLADASQVIIADSLNENYVILPLLPPYYLNIHSGDCGVLDCGIPEKMASIVLSSPPVHPEQVKKISRFLKEQVAVTSLPLPQAPNIARIQEYIPTPCLRLVNENTELDNLSEPADACGIAQLSFDYNGYKLHPLNEKKHFTKQTDEGFEQVSRNLQFETAALQRLDELGLIADDYDSNMDDTLQLEPVHIVNTWLDFMLRHKAALEADGWQIQIDDDFVFKLAEIGGWYADVDQDSNDWFSLELGVNIEGHQLNLLPLLVKYLQSLKGRGDISDFARMPDDYPLLLRQQNGQLIHVPLIKVRHIIDTLVELYEPNALDAEGRLELSRFHASQLQTLQKGHSDIKWTGYDGIRGFAERLQNFKEIQQIQVPATLKAKLRDYQQEGLNWLQFLRQYQLGGILADDMGLGKTVQTLAHILVEKESGRCNHPNLVVAPTSLMLNWKREASRFSPALKVLVLQGAERKHKFSQIPHQDLVLTTYPLLSRDSDVLLRHDWHLVILDESQHIKNPRSRAAQTAVQLQSRHRLCLTGTPLENHLGEVWSQFHFLMPELLGDEKKFRTLFRIPIEKYQDSNRHRQLLKRLSPFILRRNKSEVATELPSKTEILSEVELDGAQRDLYETIRVSMHNRVRQVIDRQGMARSQITILDALLKLRQVCCHPQLLKMPSAEKLYHSAKLNQLMEMLPEMVEEGRRILLFSQFTSMLTLIEQQLDKTDIDYVKLTGRTRNRSKPIDDFQSGKVPLFLISLKAGGSGLNLTAADTVIHYDPWWNPAVEQQATDRAHRIGQDKPVFVYRLITSGTVEHKILQLQQGKRALADALYADSSKKLTISQQDLQELFQPLS